MNDDALQGMLFGATSANDETTADCPVDELRLCALNINSPKPSRAQRIVNWLVATKSNTLVLTEMQPPRPITQIRRSGSLGHQATRIGDLL